MKELIGGVSLKGSGEREVFFGGKKSFLYEDVEVLFDGELYNKRELVKSILKRGINFVSIREEEIFAKGFLLWGESFIEKVEGVFIVFLYDKRDQKIYIFRDRVGINTIFYYKNKEIFLFGNFLKSFYSFREFEKDINLSALSFYLTHGYVARPYSIFSNTYKLKDGCYLVFDISEKNVQEKRYWDIASLYGKENIEISEEEAIERAGEILENAVVKRMKRDENLGAFLSGGYDSTTVAAILQMKSFKKIHTFTAAFEDEEFNEASFSRRSAAFLETEHHEIICNGKNASLLIPKIFDYYEEPFFDSAVIPTLQIREKALSLEIDSIFVGEGGDEVFLNAKDVDLYYKFLRVSVKKRLLLASILEKIRLHKFPYIRNFYNIETKYNKLIMMLKTSSMAKMFDVHTALMSEEMVESLLKERFSKLKTYYDENYSKILSLKEEAMSIYFRTFLLDDALVKMERAFFDTFIRVYYPYLDEELIDFMVSLDIDLKRKNGIKKYILKEILHKYIPKELMDRPKKSFSVPLSKWGREDLKDLIKDYLSKERIKSENIFDYKTVEKLKKAYFENGKNEAFQPIWLIMIFEIWYENLMKNSFPFKNIEDELCKEQALG